jgi:SAM-dependent methyltransferase
MSEVWSFVDRFPPPERPWTHEYADVHHRFVAEILDDASLVERFARAETLPPGYGVGLDERVVEFPWLIAQKLSGRVLDAGSALNHKHVLDRALRDMDALHIVTLAPEEVAFPDRGVSYVYADLRDLPYRDGYFTGVASLSTLEHVGMDNTMYGSDDPRAPDPEREVTRAVAELVRVLDPGGTLLVTVPYGRKEDHGWFRQFDRADVGRLAAIPPARKTSIQVYRYLVEGWQVSDLDEASDAEYRDSLHDPTPVRDLAAAARAVACLRFDF